MIDMTLTLACLVTILEFTSMNSGSWLVARKRERELEDEAYG